MNRFFIDPGNINGSSINLPPETAHQIKKVLRLREAAGIQVLDNLGWVYECRIQYPDERNVTASVIEKHPAEEPECFVTLFIGLTQREKFEWILQKCTEAGVSRIVPVITERTLIRKPSDFSGKQDRWTKILKEAAEQCGRGRIPELAAPLVFSGAVRSGTDSDAALFFWECEKQNTLRSVFSSSSHTFKSISLMVGPEGGFTEEEYSHAVNSGWLSVTLGKRIYRMETAAVVSVVLTLYEIENTDHQENL